ncbi:hypothetical protein Pcinc_041146 [Petrolisthes cinctipes]|uniref:EGF-like domain-containing protein n=1 Tax=Petrolisthes cinctipes TaxID=88211 RepID=A0AAE1BK49_PETCI|nr:hypothetical protein Pcinc_041146 [Petrolisthes cinctipes]
MFMWSVGYRCGCVSGYSGRHCHLPGQTDPSLRLSLAALVTALVWCVCLFLLVCAFLLHQHHRRSSLRRGAGDGREAGGTQVEGDKGHVPHCPSPPQTPNLLELQLLKPPRANGQPAWISNPNIADVDVLQVDAASVTSSVEDQQQQRQQQQQQQQQQKGKQKHHISCIPTLSGGRHREGCGAKENRCESSEEGKRKGEGSGESKRKVEGGSCNPTVDDLRNYAYEGDGSSPGSLSSCLESCSGSGKFLGGFREAPDDDKPPSILDAYHVQKCEKGDYRRSGKRTDAASKSRSEEKVDYRGGGKKTDAASMSRSEERVDNRNEGMIQSVSSSVDGSVLSVPSPLTRHSAFHPLVMRNSN